MNEEVIAELAEKAMQGDMKAFEKLYTEFSPHIYSILLGITHDTYEAEDLTQECFISAFKNINSLKEPSKAKKWLTAIAANKGKDYLKKKKPALLGEEHEYIFDIQEEKNESVLPEESAVLDERSEEIKEIVNSVSEDKRLCLVLFYQNEMSISEIAEELGISESAVKSRLFRAREDIREEVEKRNKKGMPLFSVAPLPLILYALQKSSQAAASSFAGSAAQTAAFAGITAASQAGIATVSTAATATTAASTSASAAGTTASAATGIGAKVAAMSVAQKVVAGVAAATVATGSATVTTVVVKNKIEANEAATTAYVEEVTTAPDYGFENETVFIPSVSETETSSSNPSTNNKATTDIKITSINGSTTAVQIKETEKSTSANKTTTISATKGNTTTQKQTTTKATTKATTTTTTKAPTTTKKETTTEEEETAPKTTTTKAVTTTKAATTAKPTTTTTKAATTTTTKSNSPATVTVTVWGEETSTTKILYFEAGEKITATEIENRLSDEYGIEAIADNINITAEAGGSYSATAYE